MRKVIISVAPVWGQDTSIDPAGIARDVEQCAKKGAAMVHLHVRDRRGRLTSDLKVLEETVRQIRSRCDIMIEVSTGGVSNLTIEERCAPLPVQWAGAASLNVGSVNLGEAVYANPVCEVEYCVGQILKYKKIPEIEVFELGMIKTAAELVQKYHMPAPILLSIVLGHQGAAPATKRILYSMIDAVKEFFPHGQVLWGITQANRKNFDLIEEALDMGASTVRIGFEDSPWLAPDQRSDVNWLLVEKVKGILQKKGLSPATPDEARKILGSR